MLFSNYELRKAYLNICVSFIHLTFGIANESNYSLSLFRALVLLLFVCFASVYALS